MAHRVREAVWHRSQELTELPKGRLELAVTVDGIVEIQPWIMSWGGAVEVLEPEALRDGGGELGAPGCRALCGLRSRPSTRDPPNRSAMSAAVAWVRDRSAVEWVCLGAGLAVFGYVGWDGALWDARFQLVLHLIAIGAIAGLALVAAAWRRPAAHADRPARRRARARLRDRDRIGHEPRR